MTSNLATQRGKSPHVIRPFGRKVVIERVQQVRGDEVLLPDQAWQQCVFGRVQERVERALEKDHRIHDPQPGIVQGQQQERDERCLQQVDLDQDAARSQRSSKMPAMEPISRVETLNIIMTRPGKSVELVRW